MKAEELWSIFCKNTGINIDTKYEAWAFGGSPDNLAALVIEGVKTGTASLYDCYLLDSSEPIPKPGDYSVILDSRGEAVCVIQTTKTAIVPFDEVSEYHARKEGEGDRSLMYWRQVHEKFFRHELDGSELKFHEKILILTEEFEVKYSVYKVDSMTDSEAMEICDWRYQGDYSVYNYPSWEECKKLGWQITDAKKREGAYFSVKINDFFCAFFHIMNCEDYIEVGVGMKPEVCGNHNGRMLMELALAKIEELYYGKPVQLTVRPFNKRAIACYESVGFKIVKKYYESEYLVPGEMYLMKRII